MKEKKATIMKNFCFLLSNHQGCLIWTLPYELVLDELVAEPVPGLETLLLEVALVGETAVETLTLALAGAWTPAVADLFGWPACEILVCVAGGGTRTIPWPELPPL